MERSWNVDSQLFLQYKVSRPSYMSYSYTIKCACAMGHDFLINNNIPIIVNGFTVQYMMHMKGLTMCMHSIRKETLTIYQFV
jgi:hypothetical protein